MPFSFSAEKVAAMSATPESAGKKTLCRARPMSVTSPAGPGEMPRFERTKKSGITTKTPVRSNEVRSRNTSQRISRQAISHHFIGVPRRGC